jgi:hypothetical protein
MIKKIRTVSGDQAIEMIYGLIEDINADDLAKILQIVIQKPVSSFGNDKFVIGEIA